MKAIRNSVSLFSKNKLNINNRNLKHSETKVLSNFSSHKNKLIRLNSNYAQIKNAKIPSIFIPKINLQFSELKQKQSKELSNSRGNIFVQSSDKRKIHFQNILTKRHVEDKYLNYVKNIIFKKISKKYTSPYIHGFNNEGSLSKNKQIESFTYYNYYLICNLIANKRCKFNLRYKEFIYFYNKQEYLNRNFGKNESFIIMNYLLYIVYAKDIATISKRAKKLLTENEIKNMFNNLVNNNYIFEGTMEIVHGIAVYYKHKGTNNPNTNKIVSNLDNIKPILEQKINYIYVKDIPGNQLSNCIPQNFLLEPEVINYLKDFNNKRKYTKIIESNVHNPNEPKTKKRRQYFDKNKLKGNILTNVSLFMSKDLSNYEESKETKDNKRKDNSDRRIKYDKDINEVELLVEKILGGLKNNNEINLNKNNKKYTKKINRKVLRQKSKRVHSMIGIPSKHLKDGENIFQSPKLNNLQTLDTNDLNKKVFKTSLKHIGITTSKNVVRYIKKISGNNLKINKEYELNKKIGNDSNLKGEKASFKKLLNISNVKYKTIKNRDYINKGSKKLRRFDGFNNDKSIREQKISIKNSTNNYNSNSIKDTSSNDSLFYHKIKNISKFLASSNKNKYSINRYFSLKKWNSYSTKNLNISVPKKISFHGSRKAFSTYTGMKFKDKEVNIWENNKIDTDIINVAVKTSFLLNKMSNIYGKNIKSFQNSNTLKKLIKYPLIYFSNVK